jgi:hypothetical protein
MVFYSASITSRLRYIVEVLFEAVGIEQYELTTDIDAYKGFIGPKINYSSARITEDELWIGPASLLFEKDIKPQPIKVFQWKDHPAFYKTAGDLPFDLLAASFYLISRYEEYLPHKLDAYGRFAHKNSVAYKNNFLQLPLVNLWLKELTLLLTLRFPSLSLKFRAFTYIPTYDIDIAWSYLNKGIVRNAGGFVRSLLKAKGDEILERMSVLKGAKADPFNSYSRLNDLNQKTNCAAIYFFLVAKSNQGYDKNILPGNKEYQELIKKHAANYAIGIHPSWQSGDKQELLQEEIECLGNITGKRVNKSRQHYIRMKLPDTYRKLIAAGITEDYSMGYGSINGFRASYCLPYKCYDLEKEEITSLTMYPFCYMEANSYYEQNYSAQQALEEMEHYYKVTKNVNGLLITIWHNHFLGTDKMFEGWKEVYEEFMRKHFYKSTSP